MGDYDWLVGKTYHGCNDHPYRDVQDGRLIAVLGVVTEVDGDVCFSGGDKPQSKAAQEFLNRNAAGKPLVLVETFQGHVWLTAAKWVADEILRQHELGWITICPDCGSTDTQYMDECETTLGQCNTCGIMWDPNSDQVKCDQDRLARGMAPLHPIADLLEHGPIDFE